MSFAQKIEEPATSMTWTEVQFSNALQAADVWPVSNPSNRSAWYKDVSVAVAEGRVTFEHFVDVMGREFHKPGYVGFKVVLDVAIAEFSSQ